MDGAERSPCAAQYRGAVTDARTELLKVLGGYMATQALAAAVELGLPDLVGDEPVPLAALAGPAGIPAVQLARLLRALRTVGVFDLTRDGVVHTEQSRLLRSDAEASVAPHVRMHVSQAYAVWPGLRESLADGASAFERQRGTHLFDWLAANPDDAAVFNAAMASGSGLRGNALLEHDWSAATHVVDVGGGTGANIVAVLRANPHLTGTVLDLPHLREEAQALIAAAGLTDRCEFAAGSFLESVPSADSYVLAAILHDWPDEDATRILRTLGRSAPPGATLLVADAVLDDGRDWSWPVWLDLHMLVMLGGRERTAQQWHELLEPARWRVTGLRSGLIECTTA